MLPVLQALSIDATTRKDARMKGQAEKRLQPGPANSIVKQRPLLATCSAMEQFGKGTAEQRTHDPLNTANKLFVAATPDRPSTTERVFPSAPKLLCRRGQSVCTLAKPSLPIRCGPNREPEQSRGGLAFQAFNGSGFQPAQVKLGLVNVHRDHLARAQGEQRKGCVSGAGYGQNDAVLDT